MLDALDVAEFEGIEEFLEPCELSVRSVVIERGSEPSQILFVTKGMVSLVSRMADGSSVETAVVGREGAAGLPRALAREAPIPVEGIVQLAGSALGMPVERFRKAVDGSGRLRSLVDRYMGAMFAMASQNAACNRLHQLQERASRWLLIARDRADSDDFPLTHEFMAQMLGVRRATVSEAAEDMQEHGAISYRRGQVKILDRSKLEAAACECYEVIRSAFDGLYA